MRIIEIIKLIEQIGINSKNENDGLIALINENN